MNNCLEYNDNLKEKLTKEKSDAKQSTEEPSKTSKKSFSLTSKRSTLKDKSPHKHNNNFGSTIADNSHGQVMEQKFINMYITNLDNKKDLEITKFQIYPVKKESNLVNYNIFEFYWLTEDKTFKVFISTPLIEVVIRSNNIKVKKFVDFELLFYLYEKNFENWDFYLVKYLSSFKSFRNLLEEINSINEASNKNFYLTQTKIKYYLFNNYEINNIISTPVKDILENLVQGLGNIVETKEEEEDKKGNEKAELGGTPIDLDADNNKEEKKNEEKDKEEFENRLISQRCFSAVVRFIDNRTFKANEYTITFNFNQFKKFEAIEKYVDKVSFLIKFLDLNYIKKSVTMNYNEIDNFDEIKWIDEHNHFNTHYLQSIESKKQNEGMGEQQYRTNAEYIGINKNTVIQVEINPPTLSTSLVLSNGSVVKGKINLNNAFQEKIMNIKKDDILELSKIYQNCFQEEQNKK